MKLYMGMNFEYYDCRVQGYKWDEANQEVVLSCMYQDKEKVTAVFINVVRAKYLEILPYRVIEYMKCAYNEKEDNTCFEVKCKGIVETAMIWKPVFFRCSAMM